MNKSAKEISVKMAAETPRVLSIQPHIVHGYVGNKCAVFPLQVLGFEVDAINNLQYSTHVAYSYNMGNVLKKEEMEVLMEGLRLNEVDYYTHFIIGYFRTADCLKQMTEIIKKLREKNPGIIFVCDPVMGDNGIMYVPEEFLPVYRDEIVPLADIITPNKFEAELITGMKITDLNGALDVIQALHNKGVKTVVLTDAGLGDDHNMIGMASTKGGPCYQIEIPKVEGTYTGLGDLFAPLFLAWSHKTNNDIRLSLEKTIATLQAIVKDTYQKARDIQPIGKIPTALNEMRLIQNKRNIEDPVIAIKARMISKTK